MVRDKGIFINIEGCDGVGKTTLVEKLKKVYPDAVYVREPGGTELGEKLREILLSGDDISKKAQLYLYAASRAELVEKVILPNLYAGKVVISDRYICSSIVYQGALAGLGESVAFRTNVVGMRGADPDLIITLIGDKSFRKDGENKLDAKTSEEYKKMNDTYRYLVNIYENDKIIEVAGKTEDEVFEEANKYISQRFEELADRLEKKE